MFPFSFVEKWTEAEFHIFSMGLCFENKSLLNIHKYKILMLFNMQNIIKHSSKLELKLKSIEIFLDNTQRF